MSPPSLRVRDVDFATVRRLETALRVRPATARCLAGRGVGQPEDAQRYLEPRLGALRPPAGLAGFTTAVERLAQAVHRGERVGIFGDYDVDGVTTAALLTSFLAALGVDVVTRVARRDAGYGFGEADAGHFVAQGCGLIITGDCGTSDHVAVGAARAAGVDVVVVDHHTVPAAGEAHPATALVNPLRHDSTFPFRGLASVGLAFYLVAALRTHLDEKGFFARRGIARPDVRELLDLVALGTIADLVPLRGENRILARFGIERLASAPRPGVAALLRVSQVDPGQPINERTIAWKLAPRLNAPGRLGDADPALRLLLATPAEAEARAAALDEANTARRGVQDRVLEEALAAIERGGEPGPAIGVAGRGWAPGVVGIVAAKLVDLYRRPAFVVAVDAETGTGRGSARSAGGVDLYQAMAACAPRLIRFGGHAAAAGLTVDEGQVGALRDELCAAVAAQLAGRPLQVDEGGCDAEVRLDEVDEHLAAELNALAPFGQGNGAPLLLARGLRVRASRRVGDGSHLKLELEDGGQSLGAIGFGLGELDPGVGARIDVGFTPAVSTWRGAQRVELELKALSLAS